MHGNSFFNHQLFSHQSITRVACDVEISETVNSIYIFVLEYEMKSAG